MLKCLCKARWNCVNVVGVFGMLTVEPLNITTRVGDNVTMLCQTSLSAAVEWHRRLLSADRFEIFCYNGSITDGYKDKFSILNPETGMYVITVRNIQLNDSGEYRCIEGVDKNPEYGTVHVQVIGNDISFYRVSSKLSIRQSFTFWYKYTVMNAHIIKLFPPCSRAMTSCFLRATSITKFQGELHYWGYYIHKGLGKFVIFDGNCRLSWKQYELGPRLDIMDH